MSSHTNWEADKMLDVYIHDYFVKRKLHNSAKAFQQEGKVSTDPVAIDAPGGFLFEWWSVFWDIFIARTNEKHSDAAAAYIENHMYKTREAQQIQQKTQQQQMQVQLMQRHAQQQQQQQQQQQMQQRRDGGQLLNGNSNPNAIASADMLMRQNSGTANAMAAKMYEDNLKPSQRDPTDDMAIKQRFGGDNMGQVSDPSHASILKPGTPGGQAPGQPLHGTPGGMSGSLQQFQNQNRNQQLPLTTPEIKSEMNQMMNMRSSGSEGSLIGVPGSNQAGNNLYLKGWPLPALDSLQLQQQKSMMQTNQPVNPFQMQQQIMLQQNLAAPSAMDMEARKMRMFVNNRNMGLGKDGQLNSMGDVVPNVGSPMQQQLQNNQAPQLTSQNLLSGQQTQIPNQLHQPDKMIGTGSMTMDVSMNNSFRGNDQGPKNQIGRKRKQQVSSSGPANSSGTANTAGPSPSSAPSTPSTHTPGDVMSMPSLHNGASSKPPVSMFGSDTHTSGPNHLADMGRFVDDATLDDNVESFLSQEEGDPRDSMGRGMDVMKGPFKEIFAIQASTDKVTCCHFSSDGKLLATGGRDKKAILWLTDNQISKATLEEHTHAITDVRFSPTNMSRLATSSFDRTVRVWDADNPEYSLRNFTGHSAAVMSLDFHPVTDDRVCSCDDNGQIRYWSITNGSCLKVFEFQSGMTQVRFQPRHGKYLAAAAENHICLFDAETQTRVQALQGHTQKVQSLCWDTAGERLASVSEDLVRVWAVNNNKWQCINELNSDGNKFHSCVFHPFFSHLLIIGCYQNLDLWDMSEKKTMIIPAHEGLVAALASSATHGMVASASHDKSVKIWK